MLTGDYRYDVKERSPNREGFMNLGFGLGKCCQGYGQSVPCFGEKKCETVQPLKSQEVSKVLKLMQLVIKRDKSYLFFQYKIQKKFSSTQPKKTFFEIDPVFRAIIVGYALTLTN